MNGSSVRNGCRTIGTHFISMPNDIVKIGFSIGLIEKITFIAGIHLISQEGIRTNVGYVSDVNTTFVNVQKLNGFILALGSKGLHAIRVVSAGDKDVSKWIGDPSDSPITERLAHFKSMAALQVGFDVSEEKSSLIIIKPNEGLTWL